MLCCCGLKLRSENRRFKSVQAMKGSQVRLPEIISGRMRLFVNARRDDRLVRPSGKQLIAAFAIENNPDLAARGFTEQVERHGHAVTERLVKRLSRCRQGATNAARCGVNFDERNLQMLRDAFSKGQFAQTIITKVERKGAHLHACAHEQRRHNR